MSTEWTYYHAALAGENPAILVDTPQPGYYRARMDKEAPMLPVMIYPTGVDSYGNLTLKAVIGYYDKRDDGLWREVDAAEIWTWCANKPVRYTDYLAACKTHRWARERDRSSDMLALAEDIIAKSEDGGELESLWKKLEEARKAENAAHLDEKRLVDAKFKATKNRLEARMKELKQEREAA